MERLKHIKETLLGCIEGQMGHLDTVNTEELGDVVDMVKDLEEAIYYCTITKAMEGKEKMGDTYHNYYDMSRPQEHSKSRDTREGKSHMTRKVYMEARELN